MKNPLYATVEVAFFSGSTRNKQKKHQQLLLRVTWKPSWTFENGSELNASFGWVTRLKQQSRISETAVQGERPSTSDAPTSTFHTHFWKYLLEGNLKPDQIYYNRRQQHLVVWWPTKPLTSRLPEPSRVRRENILGIPSTD